MNREEMLRYADSILAGVDLQPGQLMAIMADDETLELVKAVGIEAYKMGALEVGLLLGDSEISKARFKYAPLESFEKASSCSADMLMYYLSRGGCLVNIMGSSPDSLKDADTAKLAAYSRRMNELMFEPHRYTNGNLSAWTIAGYPGASWARKVFPELEEDEAQERLWRAILKCSYAEGEDPAADWRGHVEDIRRRSEGLTAMRFRSLHFTSKQSGTDLVVGICEDATWAGGINTLPDGRRYTFNMPTEEVLTSPHRAHVDGVVYCSLPLSSMGTIIDGFWMRFENGVVTDYGAEQGYDALTAILSVDEGARHLGEIALVPFSSPVNQTGILFYNTLFDENAVCHFAVGSAYPFTVGGEDRSDSALEKKGMNISTQHVDCMFGTGDMLVVGETADGNTAVIMENGEFSPEFA